MREQLNAGARMRLLDRVLQTWRMRVAASWIPNSSRLLDIGCHQGEFLRLLGERIGPSIGIDPILGHDRSYGKHTLLARTLDSADPLPDQGFDAIAMLATLEHIEDKDAVARQCWRLLRPGGRLVITVPSLLVDRVLKVLIALRLATGMSLEQHHEFAPQQLPGILQRQGFRPLAHRTFQFGFNHLFVFERPSKASHEVCALSEQAAGLSRNLISRQ
jgi:2-polyprenyl-3-methyl-5-hydroxy-6-metoxy-1,4-benzoquinol methylase